MSSLPPSGAVRRYESIRAHLFLWLGLILVVSLITALGAFVSLRQLRSQFQNTVIVADEIRERGLVVENNFLIARKAEAEFLLGWHAIGYDQAAELYKPQVWGHLQAARQVMREMENLLKTIEDPQLQALSSDITQLRDLFRRYEVAFETAAQAFATRSSADGLESRLAGQLAQLEKTLQPTANPSFYQTVLELRAVENAYLISNQPEAAAATQAVFKRFYALLADSAPTDLMTPAQTLTPTLLTEHLVAHEITFNEIVQLNDKITANLRTFAEVTTQTETVLTHIGTESEAGANRAHAALDTLGTQIGWYLGASIALTLGLTLLAIIRLARRVLSPLGQLQTAAALIEQGTLDQVVTVKNRDEFSILAAAFNRMTTRLREVVGSLENKVAERTRRLEMMARLSESLSTILVVEELLIEVLYQLKDGFHYDRPYIY